MTLKHKDVIILYMQQYVKIKLSGGRLRRWWVVTVTNKKILFFFLHSSLNQIQSGSLSFAEEKKCLDLHYLKITKPQKGKYEQTETCIFTK